MVKVKALDSFMHDSFNLRQGEEVEMSDGIAADLEGVGLVARLAETKEAPPQETKPAPARSTKKK